MQRKFYHREIILVVCLILSGLVPAIFRFDTGLAAACPLECSCSDRTVDCSRRGLHHIPGNIPESTERLYLQYNNLTRIGQMDLMGLHALIKLQLNGNRIFLIHQHAFDGLTSLRFLLLDHNNLFCLHQDTFRSLWRLEVMTLNSNNLTHLREETLRYQGSLRTFRLHTNPLRCDCHLSWLGLWLKRNPSLAVFTHCHQPAGLRGVNLALASIADFTCTTSDPPQSCERLVCPPACTCEDNVVECRGRELDTLPPFFPFDAQEIRLEGNNVQEVPKFAFASYPQLTRIDLSNNRITKLGENAFRGLDKLTSLVLYGNKLKSLPVGIFEDLNSLQLLLLNANELRCLRGDVFDSLNKLTLLSLYDNKLQTLPKQIFDSLKSLSILHLGKNQFSCDCNLKWLSKYLKKNPVELSGVKCHSPSSLMGLDMASLRTKRFKCTADEREPTFYFAEECDFADPCPSSCTCENSIVDCSGQGLTSLPENVPSNAAELILSDNQIEVLENSNTFQRLRNLKRIDLSSNQLRRIEEGAFEGASSVLELLLNNNRMSDVNGLMFRGLRNLKSLMLRNNLLTCVGNHTFAGLTMVTHLSLYSNQISVVTAGAFESMTSLSTLNVLSNPLDCNCHLSWLSPWLRHGSVAAGNPRCEEPQFLRGLPVADINPRDFNCNSKATSFPAPTCVPVKKCPEQCNCEGTVVRCVNRGLTTFPIDDLPRDVTELYLERNFITAIPDSINELIHLRTLRLTINNFLIMNYSVGALSRDLSNNRVAMLRGGSFSSLTHLSTLLLSYNRIRCVPPNAFSGLRSLKILNLHSNNLSTLPETVFNNLPSLLHVGLGANSWHCDCQMRWFASWVRTGNFEAGIARCDGPKRMSGRLLISATSEDFACIDISDFTMPSICNPCQPSPCLYNSTCILHQVHGHQCICQPGFSGQNCERPSNPCLLQPCQNEGSCKAQNEVTFICLCQAGFEGETCDVNIDDCQSNPCYLPNSTCIDGVDQYTCRCPVGWTGTNCDVIDDPCVNQQPCSNGGTCALVQDVDSISYRCTCSAGYEGVNCSERVDPCRDHKCENGGQCEPNGDSLIGYQCHCQGEYRGLYCTFSPGSSVILSDDPCSQHDCQNGGQCYAPPGGRGYECRCLSGYTGKRCEKLVSISFHRNGSYVQLPTSLGGNDDINITLIFSTSQRNGILLYNGDVTQSREHLAVELYLGHVRVSYDLGKFPGSKLYSEDTISDGRTHKISILIRSREISLQIDDSSSVDHETEAGSQGVLDVTTPAYIGGIASESMPAARTHWHFRNSTSFKGCFAEVYINSVMTDFSGLLPVGNDVINDVRPGCNRRSCPVAYCFHGQCVLTQGSEMTCRCEAGFTGKRCDQQIFNSSCDASRNLCQHGFCSSARSKRIRGPEYICVCDSGYSGRHCDRYDPCSNASCGRGSCVATSSGYECQCRKHFTGTHCNIRIRACSSSKVRQFHRIRHPTGNGNETISCGSKKRISTKVCGSSCASGSFPQSIHQSKGTGMNFCCKPLRTLPKVIPMRCENGVNMNVTIDKVRKCGCLPCT